VARHHCRRSEEVYIVEGYFDVIALHQHGIREAVATLGTSLTREHVHAVQGLIGADGRAYLVFDSDEAGIKAARRSVALFEKGFVDARVLVLPPGHDPDSFVFRYGAEKLQELAATAKGLMTYLIDSAVSRHGKSMEGRIRVLDEMAAPLAALADPGGRSVYIKYLAETVDIDEAAVREKIADAAAHKRGSMTGRYQGDKGYTPARRKVTLDARHGRRIENKIVAMMMEFPEILPVIREKRVVDYIEDPLLKCIALETIGERANGLVDDLDENDKMRTIARLRVGDEQWEYKRCLDIISQLLTSRMRARAAALDRRIKAAEKQQDQALLLQLLQERKQLTDLKQKMLTAPVGPRL
jgi:DNA primase